MQFAVERDGGAPRGNGWFGAVRSFLSQFVVGLRTRALWLAGIAARACTPRFNRRRSWLIFLGLIGLGVWLNFDYRACPFVTWVNGQPRPPGTPPDVQDTYLVRNRYGWPWRSVLIENHYDQIATYPPFVYRFTRRRIEIDWSSVIGVAALVIGGALFLAKFHDGPIAVNTRAGLRHYLPRYRLRTLMLYSAALSLWLAATIRRGAEQKALVELIKSKPGNVQYLTDRAALWDITPPIASGAPKWVEFLLGEDCFRDVVAVGLSPMTKPRPREQMTAEEFKRQQEEERINPYRRAEFSLDELRRLTALRGIELLALGDTDITPDTVRVLQEFPWLAQIEMLDLTAEENHLLSQGLPKCRIKGF